MKVIIIAAGVGSRLGDLTKNLPKPLLAKMAILSDRIARKPKGRWGAKLRAERANSAIRTSTSQAATLLPHPDVHSVCPQNQQEG